MTKIYKFTEHAQQRIEKRGITPKELEITIEEGFFVRNIEKDTFEMRKDGIIVILEFGSNKVITAYKTNNTGFQIKHSEQKEKRLKSFKQRRPTRSKINKRAQLGL